jgi:hypothetical protein
VQSSVAELSVFLSLIVHGFVNDGFVNDRSVQSTESLDNVKILCFFVETKTEAEQEQITFSHYRDASHRVSRLVCSF